MLNKNMEKIFGKFYMKNKTFFSHLKMGLW